MSDFAPSPIAVIGASARLPGAESVEAFWEFLAGGRDAFSEGDGRFSFRGGFLSGADEFDSPFFGVDAGEARKMDPQQRLALQEAWRTFEDAGYAPDRLRGKNVGVFVGARTGDYHDAILGRPEELEPQTLMGHDTAILSARVSHFLDLKGPNMTVNTACSSMGVALHLAVQSLRAGEVDMALVGGVHVMSTAQRFLMHGRSRLLSKSGQCRPFDERADGFVLGEAVGFVLLKRRGDAVADRDGIRGNIIATGVNHDGYCEKGIAAPNPEAQVALIRQVLEKASVPPETIGYVEAHGTGTYKGDALEVGALREAYGAIPEKACAIGSVKANVGHALTAAVLPGLLKILLGFRHGKLARQAHFDAANELMRLGEGPFRVPTETEEWQAAPGLPRRAALSAFSYAGTNFHMILEEEPLPAAVRNVSVPCLVLLSGKTRAALREQVVRLEAWLARHRTEAGLQDVAYTLAAGRAHFVFREAFVAGDVNECLALLRNFLEREGAEAGGSVETAQGRADALLADLAREGRGGEAWVVLLRELAGLYKQGAAIAGDALFDVSARPISLPGYPFERQRHWLGKGGEADLTLFLSRRDDVYQSFLSPGEGRPVVQVKCGDGFRRLGPSIYQVDPRREDDYRRLLEALGPLDGRRVRVVHLWNYECEALDFAHHGNIDRCLHGFGRGLDTGARSLSLLHRSLARSGASLLETLFLHHGLQPQNGMAAGWLEDEGGGDASAQVRSLNVSDRSAKPADIAAMLRGEIGKGPPPAAPTPEPPGERLVLDAERVYLIDVGNDRSGLRFVEEWARRGAGKLVAFVDPARLDEARARTGRGVLWLPAEWSGGDDLKRLGRELDRAGFSEVHGVVRLLASSDRAAFERNVAGTLLLDEFTNDSPLDFFVLLELDAPGRLSGATRFANGFVELRQQMARRGRRRGRQEFRRGRDPVAAFEEIFEAGAASRPTAKPVRTPLRGAHAMEARFRRIVSEALQLDGGDVDLSAPLDTLPFDSMRIVDVIDRVQYAFGTALRPALFYRHKTLRGVFDEWMELASPPAAFEDWPEHKAREAAPGGPAPEPVAIVGMSGRFPMAGDLREFWNNLRDGRDGVREIPADRWDWRQAGDGAPAWGGFIDDIDKFDPAFFGISAREAELMDPQQRLFLQCAWHAVEDSGHAPEALAGTPTGVFVGVATCDYASILDAAGQGRQAHSPIGLFHSMLANRLSYLLDLRGPSQPIDTACASSLVAVHRAVQAIRGGQCSQAIVGGVNALLTPPLFAAFRQAGMLSEDGRCKTFDEGANGYVRGEGVGALFLKPLRRALADGDDVYAVIRSSAENHGGRASSLTAPSPRAQAEVVARAYREAGIDPRTVGYIEAHGTGTALGDPIEIDGLRQAFEALARESGGPAGAGHCGLGSVKTQIGHLEAAAGIAGLIKAVLALRNRTLPGNLHFRKPNPHAALEGSPFYVVDTTRPWEACGDGAGGTLPRRAGVSSFGFGGVNAHVVLEEYAGAKPGELSPPERDCPIVLSARTEERLREYAGQLLHFLQSRGEGVSAGSGPLTLRNLAYTLQIGRTPMEERLGMVVNSLEALEAALTRFLEGNSIEGLLRGRAGERSAAPAMFADEGVLRDAVDAWTRQGRWAALVELWVKGLPVDWRGLHDGESPLRLHLPAYPFARERYWAESSGPAVRRRTCLLRKQWEACPSRPARDEGGAVLILAGRETEGLAQALLRHFPGGAILGPESSEAISFPAEGYAGCIDLGGCGTEEEDRLAWVEPIQGFIQGFIEQGIGREPLLLGVTRGLESFRNTAPRLSGALRAGLYRMLQSEYPAVRSRHLDADPEEGEEALAERIAEEFRSGGDEVEVCHRGGTRYRACLREVPFVAEDGVAAAFPPGHVLWVTGGTRGLGSLCAAHLVRRSGVRKLVLTGREAFPSRKEWDARERQGGPVAEKIRAIRALEAQGAEVRVVSVDLADASALRRCLDEVRADLGQAGGVLHCAGVVDAENPAFIRKAVAGMRGVLAPKVAGTDVLRECFRDEPLAFMAFFSSVSAVVPGLAAGLGDYAMANAYLDYAAAAGRFAFPVFSIQWPSWKEAGMGEVRSEAYVQAGFLSQTNAEGLRFLDRILAEKAGFVGMPVVCDPERWAPERLLTHRPRRPAAPPVSPALEPAKASASILEAARAWLAGLFARELKAEPDKLKPGVPFQDYGMDSILLAQVWARINRELGTRLDPSAVFEHSTLEALAAWLVRTQADALGRALGGAPGPEAESLAEAAAIPAARPEMGAGKGRSADIAVVGASCRFPGANDLDAYWRLLAEGRTAIVPVPGERWENPDGFVAGLIENAAAFDPGYFLLSEADARAMDPQALLVLEEGLNLFHHAGYAPGEIKGAAIGVYLGARTRHRPQASRLSEARNPILAVGQNYLAANVSRFFDLRGPSLVVDTACSSALVGMSLALQALRSGEIGAAVVGGVSLLADDSAHRLFRQRNLLNPGASFHLFDRRASGVVLGEGVGMVLLKTVEQAEADGDRIYAVVKGLAVNNDGRTAGPATPNIHAHREVMRAALERSGVRPGEVDYIEANGSGSEVTDLLELKAVEAVYGEGRRTPCQLGSVKPHIGHPLCAEGIAGFIKLVLMLDRRRQPPFLSGEAAMAHYDLASSPFSFRRDDGPWQGGPGPLRAALNCFADGGTNAHVILEGWEGGTGPVRRAPLVPPVLNRRNMRETAANPWPAVIGSGHPFLRHHVAYGQPLLPGLAYLDMLYQFFRDQGHAPAELELGNLSIHRPLAVPPGGEIRLEIHGEQRGEGAWRVRVEGEEISPDGSPRAKVLYVTAEMRCVAPVVFGEAVDLDVVRAASEAVPLHEAYAHFREKGLAHTGPMKAEGTIHVSSEARVIELSLPPEARPGAAAFLFHPALVDGAAVGAGPLFEDLAGGDGRLFLPLFFGKFRASGPLGDRCVARVRKGSLRRKNELLYSDMEFFDQAGTKVAELTGFAYKLVREAALIQAGTPGEPAPETLPPPPAGPAGLPGSGAARLLQAVIASKLKRAAGEVDVNLGYYELGLDSAMLLDVVAALERRLSLPLSPTLLFEYATPAELAAHLEEVHPEEVARLAAADEAEGEPASPLVVLDFPVGELPALPDSDRKKTEALVAELVRGRLALWVEGGNLKARAEAGRLTPELQRTIRENRDAIARLLGRWKLLPLTRSQRRYWVLSSLQPDKSAYNNPIGMRLRGDADVGLIREAFRILMNGHHVLRSHCPRLGKGPVLGIAPPLAELPGEVIGLAEADAEAREQALRELAARESREPINPAVGPNVRLRIVRMAEDDVAILLTAHHAVFDGYSYLPVMSEFMRIYRALKNGEIPGMEGLPQYEEYALREKPEGDRRSARFWRDHLAGAPAGVALPLDRERAMVNAGHGDVRSIRVDAGAYRSIHETIREHQATLFAFMLSILKAAVSSWAGQADLVFGTTVQCGDSDRRVIGDFTNFIPIRSRVGGTEPFARLLKEVSRTSLRCLQHKNFPFDEIVPMAPPAPPNINPVYNILVNQLPSLTEMEERLSDGKTRVRVSNNRLLNRSAMLDLRFEWYEEEEGLRLICEYNTGLFRDETIEGLLGRIGACLDARSYAGEGRIGDLMPFGRTAPVPAATETVPPAAIRGGDGAEALVTQKILELKEVPEIENRKDVSFFELGLGSFDVANLSAELEALYPEFVVGDIFKHPTIRLLAAHLDGSFRSPPLPTEAVDCPIDFGLFRT